MTLGAAAQSSLLKADGVESILPNIEVSLRIYLSLMASNCTGERSPKTPHRSTMSQDWLNCCALMSCENDILQEIDFTEFASLKSRKPLM